MKWAPHASNAMGTLISKLSTLLPPPKVQELQSLYGSYRVSCIGFSNTAHSLLCVLTTLNFSSPTNCLQEGKLGKEVFMRQLRSVAGDELLRSTILEIRG